MVSLAGSGRWRVTLVIGVFLVRSLFLLDTTAGASKIQHPGRLPLNSEKNQLDSVVSRVSLAVKSVINVVTAESGAVQLGVGSKTSPSNAGGVSIQSTRHGASGYDERLQRMIADDRG